MTTMHLTINPQFYLVIQEPPTPHKTKIAFLPLFSEILWRNFLNQGWVNLSENQSSFLLISVLDQNNKSSSRKVSWSQLAWHCLTSDLYRVIPFDLYCSVGHISCVSLCWFGEFQKWKILWNPEECFSKSQKSTKTVKSVKGQT